MPAFLWTLPTGRRPTKYAFPRNFWIAVFTLVASATLVAQESDMRTLRSRHLTLYTDLPSHPDVDELPLVFDQAVPLWAKFFQIPPDSLNRWKVTACLMQHAARFRQAGLLPDKVPDFPNGYQIVDDLWVHEQPSSYYRRHLLLHEGTHAVMNRIFGRVGPLWYREGTAELVATHRYRERQLRLAVFPHDKRQFTYWGRIKVIRDALQEDKAWSIEQIVNASPRMFGQVDGYAWAWALQAFGHAHPRFSGLFLKLQQDMPFSDELVTANFVKGYQAQRRELNQAWHLFLDQLDYGYAPHLEWIEHAPARPLPSAGAVVTIDTRKPWQSTGFRLPAESKVRIRAHGRYQIAKEAEVWWCEPQGITLEYYQGRPRGALLGVVSELESAVPDEFAHPVSVGRDAQLSIQRDGVLYLRINERADQLRDNQGEIEVHIQVESAGL